MARSRLVADGALRPAFGSRSRLHFKKRKASCKNRAFAFGRFGAKGFAEMGFPATDAVALHYELSIFTYGIRTSDIAFLLNGP